MLFYDKDSKLDSLTSNEESTNQAPTSVPHDPNVGDDIMMKNSQDGEDVKTVKSEGAGQYVLTGNIDAGKDILEDEEDVKEVDQDDEDNKNGGDNDKGGDNEDVGDNEEYIDGEEENSEEEEEEEEENEELKEWNLHLQEEKQR